MEFQIPFSLLGMQLGLTRHLWRANRLSDCTVQSSTVLVSVGQCCQKFSARRGQISLCNLHLTCYSFHVTASATSAISLPLTYPYKYSHANDLACTKPPVPGFLFTTLLYSYFACGLKFITVDPHQGRSNVRRTERKRCSFPETKNRVETETGGTSCTYSMHHSHMICRAKHFWTISSCTCAQVCGTPTLYFGA